MFDAHLFAIEPKTLVIHPLKPSLRKSLHLGRGDITHLADSPHEKTLQWRWDVFCRKGD
jgi:hypothetical protein